MENKGSKAAAAVFCGLVMLITAASDALRGVFLPQFRSAFALSEPEAGRIIMISYIGNLIFLSVGGYLSDRLPKKRFLCGLLLLWTAALVSYVFTESYTLLLAGMIFSMGGSTMLSTSVNLITPMLFVSPAMMVSIFNFIQGVGITASQNVGGRFADSLTAWHTANGILAFFAVTAFIVLLTLKLPEKEQPREESKVGFKELICPASLLLILICGCYFVAEHGLMNWLTSYGSEYLGCTVKESSIYLSLFFGGITVGRLIFAPFIDRIGIFRCLLIWSAAGAALYVLGIALGRSGLVIVGISGLAFSIIYPLLVMLIGRFFDPSAAGRATGFVLSTATFFDIGFNAFFGDLVDSAGYGRAIIVLPAAAVLFAVLLTVLRLTVRRSAEIK